MEVCSLSHSACSPLLCSLKPLLAGGVGKSALTTRFVKGTFLSNYDPTIEGSFLSASVRGGRLNCFLFHRSLRMHKPTRWHNLFCVFPSSQKTFIHSQPFKLEILDTAGADQFRVPHERYIKVHSHLIIIITRDPNASVSLNILQSAHGFVLVFRYAFSTYRRVTSLTRAHSLTQETSLREIEDLRQRIYHLRGDNRVRANHTPQCLYSSPCLRPSLPSAYTYCRCGDKTGSDHRTRGAPRVDPSLRCQMGCRLLRNLRQEKLERPSEF